MKRTGFTLVELLITIAIIGILSTLGLVLYSTALKQGRDSKRQSDLKTIQLALEQYNNDQGYYPDSLTFGNSLSAGTKIYMNAVPAGSPAYVYTASGTNCAAATPQNCTSYCLYIQLENLPSPLPAAPTGCTYPSDYNFAVTPP